MVTIEHDMFFASIELVCKLLGPRVDGGLKVGLFCVDVEHAVSIVSKFGYFIDALGKLVKYLQVVFLHIGCYLHYNLS